MRRQRNSVNSKIVAVNDKMGVKGIGKQQGTTRIIYDMVKLQVSPNEGNIQFFKDAKNKKFPLTNLSENKLQVGESIAMQRFSIYIVETDAGTTKARGIFPLGYFGEFELLYRSDLSFQIAQDVVIKQLPLDSMYAPFNKDSRFVGDQSFQPVGGALNTFKIPQDIFEFDNDIIIPPQIEFVGNLQINPIPVLPSVLFDYYLCMKIEGLGSLFSPKSNY